MSKMLAYDFGASSGRGILGDLKNDVLTIKEIHRFPNDPVMFSKHLQWDILRLSHEIKQGLLKCKNNFHEDIDSIGVDTWGVDFGLLDENGELLSNPYHYRDSRTDGMIEKCSDFISKEELFNRTGLLFAKYNTIYQLLSMKLNGDLALSNAKTLLMMPDLINYMLTGAMTSELTESSTSQLYNHKINSWDEIILERLSIPKSLFTKIIKPGTAIGTLRETICHELDIKPIPIIAVAGHDTASAVAAVPAEGNNHVFISSGTWSIVGIENDNQINNELAIKYNFTNEGGVNDKVLFMKNIMGLWLIQECKRTWEKQGYVMSFNKLVELASNEKAVAYIDPDDELFYIPGNMPERIKEFCSRTNQRVPSSIGEIVRCIEESLALKYKWVIEKIEEITDKKIDVIHMVGGGILDELLCKLTADITGKRVIAGPVEATAIGNIMLQAIALGEIQDINHGRKIVRNSFTVKEYIPIQMEEPYKDYIIFKNLIEN